MNSFFTRLSCAMLSMVATTALIAFASTGIAIGRTATTAPVTIAAAPAPHADNG